MATKSIHHPENKSKKEKKTDKKKEDKKQTVTGVVIGEPYNLDDLRELIEALKSGKYASQVWAVAEYAENQERISEETAKTPEISETEITELVVAAVLENHEAMLHKFESENRSKTLNFLSKSSSIPKKVSQKASAAIERISGKQQEKPREFIGKKEEPETIEYRPKDVKLLLKDMRSKDNKIKRDSFIRFIKDYGEITSTVSQMPMLSVTEVTRKALKVLEKDPKPILQKMINDELIKELSFVSSQPELPEKLKKRVEIAIETVRLMDPKHEPEKRPDITEKEKQKQPEPVKYNPAKVRRLVKDLKSSEKPKAIEAAAEFLKNYDQIVDSVSKDPLISVTEITEKAVAIIENNLEPIMNELAKAGEVAALKFISNSNRFSLKTRKEVEAFLEKLVEILEDEEEVIEESLI